MPTVCSFDVLDTVLARLVGSPAASFLLLGKRLLALGLIDCSAESFARIRMACEQRTVRNVGGCDFGITLRHIYAEVGRALGLTEPEQINLMRLELALEQEILRVPPSAAARVQEARRSGASIAYISDMHMDGTSIQKVLTMRGLFQTGDRLYASCDYAQSRRGERLFQELLRRENLAPGEVRHCGNDAWDDIDRARRLGLQVDPFPQGNMNRYEEALDSYGWMTEGLSSVLAGASRLTRLTIPATSAEQAALRDVAAGVGAPLLVGFTLWVLQRAQHLGLKRLYFGSRDGQILLEIARRLLPKLSFDCDVRYLYGSRQAWILPSLTRIDPSHLAQLFHKSDVDVLSVEIYLARLGVVPEEIRASLEEIDLPEGEWARNLGSEERERLYECVLRDDRVHQVVLPKAARARALTVRYLQQEGMLESAPVGFVDTGSRATLHRALSTILTAAGGHPPRSFYLGLKNTAPSPFDLPEGYFFDSRFRLGFLHLDGLVTFAETVCSGDHGTVLGYREDGDRVAPILSESVNQPVMEWGYGLVRETICCFAERMLLDESLLNLRTDVRPALATVLDAFWRHPTHVEALAWGKFPMEDGLGREARWLRLAKGHGWDDLWRKLLRRGTDNEHRHRWREGIWELTSPPVRLVIGSRRLVGRGASRLKRHLARPASLVDRQTGRGGPFLARVTRRWSVRGAGR